MKTPRWLLTVSILIIYFGGWSAFKHVQVIYENHTMTIMTYLLYDQSPNTTYYDSSDSLGIDEVVILRNDSNATEFSDNPLLSTPEDNDNFSNMDSLFFNNDSIIRVTTKSNEYAYDYDENDDYNASNSDYGYYLSEEYKSKVMILSIIGIFIALIYTLSGLTLILKYKRAVLFVTIVLISDIIYSIFHAFETTQNLIPDLYLYMLGYKIIFPVLINLILLIILYVSKKNYFKTT